MNDIVRVLKQIWLIINYKTIVVTGMSVVATAWCIRHDMLADFPLTLIATAVVFPVVFSIGGAYKRREVALAKYSTLKSHGHALYFSFRDWLPESDHDAVKACRTQLAQLIKDCDHLFTHDKDQLAENEKPVYAVFSQLSQLINHNLRERGLAATEVSRCNQYISKMMNAFEDIKHIYQYRTPRSLRAFSGFFIMVVPVLYGPFFAHEAQSFAPSLSYVMPTLFSFVLVSLYNIQDHLENPFDRMGVDDIEFSASRFDERLRALD